MFDHACFEKENLSIFAMLSSLKLSLFLQNKNDDSTHNNNIISSFDAMIKCPACCLAGFLKNIYKMK